MAHSRFAPSANQRVADCPASLKLNEGEPDRPSIEAAHGTSAHYIGELCLSKKKRVESYAGCVVGVTLKGDCYFVHQNRPAPEEGQGWAFEVDDEMIVAVQEYVDWCNDLDGEHFVEVRVDISHMCPETDEEGWPLEPQSGTSDHIALSSDGAVMTVTDLKYGKGVQVFAHENLQAVGYASGALKMFGLFERVQLLRIRICQPRLNHNDVWEVSREEFEKHCAYILERNTLALSDDPPFGPSEKACKFCKVAARCRALAEHLASSRAMAFDDITEEFEVSDPRLLSDEELVEAWRMTKMWTTRIAAVAKEMLRVMLQGGELPTVKLAEGKTHRQFRDKRAAELFLRLDCDLDESKVYTKQMVSPNQAFALAPKGQYEELAKLVYKPPGAPCIVDESSTQPRYEAHAAASSVFDVIASDDDDAEFE